MGDRSCQQSCQKADAIDTGAFAMWALLLLVVVWPFMRGEIGRGGG